MSAFNFKRGDKVRLPKYRANGVVDCLFSGGGDDGPPEYYVVTDGCINGWYRAEELELLGRYESLVEERDELVKALAAVTALAARGICEHEETHRGGAIWEICDSCGAKWADDEGGKPEWIEPVELTAAYAILARYDEKQQATV